MHDIEKNAGESNNNVGKLRLNTQLEINPVSFKHLKIIKN